VWMLSGSAFHMAENLCSPNFVHNHGRASMSEMEDDRSLERDLLALTECNRYVGLQP